MPYKALTIVLLLGAASAAHAQEIPEAVRALMPRPGGLTADDVARRAAATSIEARARHEEVRAAAAGVDQALAAFFPRLQLVGRYTRLSPIEIQTAGNIVIAVDDKGQPLTSGPIFASSLTSTPPKAILVSYPLAFPVVLNQTILQASLTLPLSDYVLRLAQAHAAATHNQRAAKLNEQAVRLKVASEARLLYYGWVRSRGQVLVIEQAVGQVRAHLDDVKHLQDQGMVSKADVLRVDSQLATTELLAERSRNLALVLEEQLRIVMHDASPRARYELGEDISAALPPVALGSIDDLAGEAQRRRLELRALGETSRVLEEQVKIARAAFFPSLTAFGDVLYANPNPRYFPQSEQFKGTWDVGLQLTWAPNDIGFAVAGTRAAEARAAQLNAQRDGLRDGVRMEVTQAILGVREAELAATTTVRGLASAEESYRARRDLFQNGRATSVELSDAESDLTRARLEAINARVDLRVARVRLEHATGNDVVSDAR